MFYLIAIYNLAAHGLKAKELLMLVNMASSEPVLRLRQWTRAADRSYYVLLSQTAIFKFK